jgi:prevent-host-death family protein
MKMDLSAVHGGVGMEVSVTEAKGQLTELVRRAEAGDEVILTRHGHAAVRLVPIKSAPDRKSRRTLLEAARRSGAAKAKAGPNVARSQDFLYGDDGLPE